MILMCVTLGLSQTGCRMLGVRSDRAAASGAAVAAVKPTAEAPKVAVKAPSDSPSGIVQTSSKELLPVVAIPAPSTACGH
jgi:hypothetical protein